jgi:Mrp family chromosome partitioning ATPase
MAEWKFPRLRRKAPEALQPGLDPEASAVSYSRLALRLERDLSVEEHGRSVLVAAADDDAVGVEAVTELAWYLAEELGHGVLMIDATFTRGSLSTALEVTEKPGLMELLGTQQIGVAALRGFVLPTQNEKISLLPRGHGDNGRLVPTRSDILSQLLEAACRSYDFVLVQGSVLDQSSRSVAFCGFVDAALLVAVEGRSLVASIQRGQGILNESGASRVGLVLASPPQARQPGAA